MAENKKRFNTNSNVYTVVYSIVIVIVVAFLLAFISSYLKPKQDVNVALDKKRQILAALNIRGLKDNDVEKEYKKVILRDDIIDSDANIVKEGSQGGEQAGFKLGSQDYKKGKLALYVCLVDGQTKYVVPVYGMGLWGTISGYIGIDDDKNTVYGAYFDHESETAGLGAEIKDSQTWQDQFKGKKIRKTEDKDSIALSVVKKSEVKDPSVQCDAVTGATLTSDGVSQMLKDCLKKYLKFFNND